VTPPALLAASASAGPGLAALGTALWLGVLTSISPCPLGTNVAAISFVARRLTSPLRVLAAGLLYTAGRTLVYVFLAFLLVRSLLAAPALSDALQRYSSRLLGPLLILVGMVLLDLIPLRLPGFGLGERAQERIARWELAGAFLLGALFALSFCPVSAALYFGSLLPLAARSGSALLVPGIYGAGTALPVILFAVLVAAGARSLGKAFDRLRAFERWARLATGIVFIAVGIYYSLANIFGVLG
jgi:cytochrome c biogenesis protein CcdA